MLATANAYRDSGDTSRAIEGYKKTLSRFPKTLKAAYNLAYILATDKIRLLENRKKPELLQKVMPNDKQ